MTTLPRAFYDRDTLDGEYRRDLGKDVLDDPRHTTCTGIGYHSDVVPVQTIMTVVARHFALMTESSIDTEPLHGK